MTTALEITSLARQQILIRNGMVQIPTDENHEHINEAQLATLMANLTHFGFALNEEGLAALNCLSLKTATAWYEEVKPILEKITGADKRMGDAVVYKNFPQEVLDMTEAQYWGKQILIYWGFSVDLFREPVKNRELKTEPIRLRILQLDNGGGLERIQAGLIALPARWTAEQRADAKLLGPQFAHLADLSAVKFKENMVELAKDLIAAGIPFKSTSATDVLRLAVGLSDGDVSMRTPSKFRRFTNQQRKFLTRALKNCKNLQEDMARDPEKWKRLVKAIHPGDHTAHGDGVLAAVDALYKGTLPQTFNSVVEQKLTKRDKTVLEILKTRPGEFVRRLRVCIERFSMDAAVAFADIVPKLTTIQLLKIEGFLTTFNERARRMYAPKGNWTKVQLSDETKDAQIPRIPIEAITLIKGAIGTEIKARLDKTVGSVNLDERTKAVKLQGNDSDLSPYGRGTRFKLPDDVKFVRTASFWVSKGTTVWYDNGVNFFDANWKSKGTLCWVSNVDNKIAVFSGDPNSGRTADGRACQMIDVYLDQARAAGIRYCVWNILCYSDICFDEREVHAALQWGVEPQKAELFDPARVQLSFPVKGQNKTKFLTCLDLETRELVYLDANLPGHVSSANRNEEKLEEMMPAFFEYLSTLPSVYDLFKHQKRDTAGTPVLYDDASTRIESGKAYVFKQTNSDNSYEQLNLGELL